MNKEKIIFGTIAELKKNGPTKWTDDNGYGTVEYSYLAPAGKGLELAKKLPLHMPDMPNRTIDVEEDESLTHDIVKVKYLYNAPQDPDEGDGEDGEDGEGGGDGGDGGDGGSAPGGEESQNQIESNNFCTEESLMQHPKYSEALKKASDKALAALIGLSNGNLTDEFGIKYADIINKEDGLIREIGQKYIRGQTKFWCPRSEATVTSSFRISGTPSTIGACPGLGKLPNKQEWLCMSNSRTKRGGKRVYTAKFVSGYWDADIYTK